MAVSNKEEQEILSDEKKIERNIKKIERIENKIEDQEKEIMGVEKTILKHAGHRFYPREFKFLRVVLLKKIARHKLLYTLSISTGIVLVWRGIWETSAMIPFISYPLVALTIGIIILWLSEKYTELK